MKVREAGRSLAIVEGIRNRRGYYAELIETKVFAGPNPAADLRFFIGKQAHRKARQRRVVFFSQEEGPQLVATATALFPLWRAFILSGLLAGLRWGESAALYKSDIDWRRGRIHVQRTFSEKGNSIQPCKDGEARLVKGSPALLEALRAHIVAVELTRASMAADGRPSSDSWCSRTPRVGSRTTVGSWRASGSHCSRRPACRIAGITRRATPSLRGCSRDGADLRWVQRQLGHSTIGMTADTYGHVQPERHESAAAGLDRYLS